METDRPGRRRPAGSWLFLDSESRRQRNHEPRQPEIPKRKKSDIHTRLSCKIDYLLRSNHNDQSIASEFFTGDFLTLAVDKNVPFLALDLLTRIVPVRINARPPFSALFTLWLSMMAAVGLASRCARSRHCSYSA